MRFRLRFEGVFFPKIISEKLFEVCKVMFAMTCINTSGLKNIILITMSMNVFSELLPMFALCEGLTLLGSFI